MEGMGVAGSSNFAFDSFKTFLLFLFIMLLFQVDSFSILFKRTMRGEPLAIFSEKLDFGLTNPMVVVPRSEKA